MLGVPARKVTRRPHGPYRASKATVGCEALEGRQLLSRGLGLGALAGGGLGGRAMMAELGSFGGGGRSAMFGGGGLGLRGGMRDPIFLLTSSLLNTGNGSKSLPSRSVLSSSAVQSAFQTLQTDYNNDVSVGAHPTHASVGQLQDDLESIRKGTLTGTAATTAIQNDEAAILTSLGLTSDQVSQIQSDLQAVQTAIQSGSSTTSTASTSSTSTSADGSTSTSPTTSTTTSPTTSTTTSPTTSTTTSPTTSTTTSPTSTSAKPVCRSDRLQDTSDGPQERPPERCPGHQRVDRPG